MGTLLGDIKKVAEGLPTSVAISVLSTTAFIFNNLMLHAQLRAFLLHKQAEERRQEWEQQ